MEKELKEPGTKESELERLVGNLIETIREKDDISVRLDKLQEAMDKLNLELQHACNAHRAAQQALFGHIQDLSRF